MTLNPASRFLAVLAAPALIAGGVMLATAGSASAATTGAHDYQRCDEVLTYVTDDYGQGYGYGQGDEHVVRDVCAVEVIHEGYGYQREEDLLYSTEGYYGQLRFHFVRDVRDVHVFHGYGGQYQGDNY